MNLSRSTHPDLDLNNELLPDTYTVPNAAERDFNRQQVGGGSQRDAFMNRLAAEQMLEHPVVRQKVAGETYQGTPAEGYALYRDDIRYWRSWVAAQAGKDVYVDSRDVERMSLAEYEATFDANGRPRDHVYFWDNRAVPLNSGIDRHSAREWGSR